MLIGNIFHGKYNMPMDEDMLATSPTWASDMALISADIGIESADIIFLQIIGLIATVSIYPQMIRIIVSLVD